jgi:hypothetical protein
MATFGDVLREIQERQREGIADPIRRKYLAALHRLTDRNVIVYYSGFLHRQGPEHYLTVQINDEDKHGFMGVFAGLDFNQGLDLILHSPGGDIAATESIVEYLRSKFGTNIRAIVPQISMSGGTMIALAGREIVMGRHSNLGPIDPQIGGRPAIALLDEFERARNEINANPSQAFLWQPILQHYLPTMLSQAQNAIKWSEEIGRKTLTEGMFKDDPQAEEKANTIVDFLTSHNVHRAHGRHLHRSELRSQGVKIVNLEDDPELQDAVLSVHHACMLTVGNYNTNKLVENHNGIAHMKIVGQIAVQMPIQVPTPMAPPPQAPTPAAPTQPTPALKLSFWQRLLIALRVLFLGR